MSGYRVYISATEREVLVNMLSDLLLFKDKNNQVLEKKEEKIINKLLDHQDQVRADVK